MVRRQLGEAEERVLALIEAGEQAGADVTSTRDALAELEERRAQEQRPREQRLEDLRGQLSEAEQARTKAQSELTGTEQALYGRVAARHHPAVVSIKGDTCGGCHLPLSNEERRAVRAGDQLVQCSNCDRILVP